MGKKQAYGMEWSKAQEIFFSVDLVKAAKQQLQFLAVVDKMQYLYDDPALHHAIHRYEKFWLPLLAKHKVSPELKEPLVLVVPIDCEWIWHCHRLNPEQYKTDCEEIYGCILDNANVLSTVGGACTMERENLWNQMYSNEPYIFEQSYKSLIKINYGHIETSKAIEYDLVAAVKRQITFFDKVSRVVTDDESYLKEAVAKYKAFLYLVKRSEEKSINCACVPTYDIDLIWHSHQLSPHSYSKDLEMIFGHILNHNDQTSAEAKHKINMTETTTVWEDTYGTKYVVTKALSKCDKVTRKARKMQFDSKGENGEMGCQKGYSEDTCVIPPCEIMPPCVIVKRMIEKTQCGFHAMGENLEEGCQKGFAEGIANNLNFSPRDIIPPCVIVTRKVDKPQREFNSKGENVEEGCQKGFSEDSTTDLNLSPGDIIPSCVFVTRKVGKHCADSIARVKRITRGALRMELVIIIFRRVKLCHRHA